MFLHSFMLMACRVVMVRKFSPLVNRPDVTGYNGITVVGGRLSFPSFPCMRLARFTLTLMSAAIQRQAVFK